MHKFRHFTGQLTEKKKRAETETTKYLQKIFLFIDLFFDFSYENLDSILQRLLQAIRNRLHFSQDFSLRYQSYHRVPCCFYLGPRKIMVIFHS